MKLTLVFPVLLLLVSPADSTAQFLKYPTTDDRGFLSDSRGANEDRVLGKLLQSGGINLAGDTPTLDVTVLELYIAPDIAGWNWTIPMTFITSPPTYGQDLSKHELAMSLLDRSSGVLNMQLSLHHEWRGESKVKPNAKSITGLYLDGGLSTKLALVAAPDQGKVDSYFLAKPFLTLDGRITTKDRKTDDDYSGVIHASATFEAGILLNQSSNLNRVFEVSELQNYGTFSCEVGYLPFNNLAFPFVKYVTSYGGNVIDDMRNRVTVSATVFSSILK